MHKQKQKIAKIVVTKQKFNEPVTKVVKKTRTVLKTVMRE